MLTILTYRIKALIVPSVTVTLSTNSISNNTIPANAIGAVVNINALEHDLQLGVPKAVLRPFWHFPHIKPVLLNWH